MRSYRLLVALVAISGAIAVVWLYATAEQQASRLAVPRRGGAGVVALDPARIEVGPAPGAPIPRVSSPAPSRASLARDNPYWAELDASDRLAAFRRLVTIDDPAAVVMAHEVAMWCGKYADHLYSRTLDEIEAQSAAPHVKAKQLARATRERSRCVGFGDKEIVLEGQRYRALLPKHGPRTVGMGEPTGPGQAPEILASLREAATLEDPLAIENLGRFMLNIWSRRHETYDIGDGTRVSPVMMNAAFMLAACEYGRDCGPDSGFLVAQCVNAGRCEVSSVEELYVRYWREFRLGDPSDLLATRDMVLRGIRTGQWPRDLRVLAPTRP
jgi:phage protein U